MMSLDRVESQRRWCDSGECQHVLGDDDVGRTDDGITERNVDAEGLAVDLARELALGAEAQPVVLHGIIPYFGVVGVGHDLEGHEVS